MIRDFSKEKKKEIYRALDMIDDKEWEPFMTWCGGKAGEFGVWADRLGISSYTRQIDNYQNKILGINSSAREQIDIIFESVAETDRRYAEIFRDHAETVKEQINIVKQMIVYYNFGNDMAFIVKATGVDNKGEIDNENDDEFIHSIKMAYGFDEKTAQTMKKIYEDLEKKHGDKASQLFFSLMASFSYGEVESTKNAILWGIIASVLPVQLFGYKAFKQYGITEEEYSHMKTQLTIQHMLCEMPQNSSSDDLKNNKELKQYMNEGAEKKLGISFEEFPEEIKGIAYEQYLRYCNKVDFTHMCATSATILYDGKEKNLGDFAGAYNGIFSVEGNAGYVGDVYGTNGTGPTMGNADYMADLDAVNISNRIKKGKGASDAISEYYGELENEKTNRAREFKYNIGEGDERFGLNILVMESLDYYEYLEESGMSEDDIEKGKDMVRRFFISLINEYNYLYEE